MRPRQPTPAPGPQLTALLQEAVSGGQALIDELVPRTREALLRQIEATRDLAERDACARAIGALLESAPALRLAYGRALREAFDSEVGGNPVTTTLDAGPTSLNFDQLELMDEQQVQARITAVRGLQQVLQAAEAELAELNALVCTLMGLDEVQSERNPLRPEIYLETLQDVVAELPADAAARSRWSVAMAPLLGPQLRQLYRRLLGQLRQQRVQPARYAISRPVGGAAGGRYLAGGAAPVPGQHAAGPTAPASARLTVQQLHGLVSGVAQDAGALAQEVVNLVIAHIAGDPRMLPSVWQLVYELEPALLALASHDLNFFHDKRHPARLLLEEIAQRSFAYESEEADGFPAFLDRVRQALSLIDPAQAGAAAPFAAALVQLQRGDQVQQAQQAAAIQALQQAERRNKLAQQIADHIRAQPDTVLVPDVVVDFACGPWAQVMAHAQVSGNASRPGEPDHVALLEDLFWSVRPDQTRQQPGQLARIIPGLVQGLRQGLASIAYPETQAQAFLEQLFELHQGRRATPPLARARAAAAQPWLAPQEAQDSGFIDDLGGGASAGQAFAATEPAAFEPDFPATEPAAFEPEFPATEPMSLEQLPGSAGPATPDGSAAPLALDQLQPGQWVELMVSGHWMRLQLVWLSDNATLCLFASPGGSNHSMTRRMFDRLVQQGQLRALAQGAMVERAFNAVAELAMRNSVYMELPPGQPG